MKASTRGFTVIELCMALVSMAVLIMVASQILLSGLRDFYFYENQMNLSDRIILVSRLIENEFTMSGGNFLPPWLSMQVENNCTTRIGLPDCAGSDRLSIATSLYDPISFAFFPTLSVNTFDTVNKKISISFSPPALPCPIVATQQNQHVLMTNATTTEVYSLWTTNVDLVNCTFTVESDVQGNILNSANFATTNYALGALSFVRIRSYYLDTIAHQLKYLEKTTNSATLDPADIHNLIYNVYDFQLALGYDTAPQDGQVDDSGTNIDEVLYNAPGDSIATLGGVGAGPSDLRQLFVAFVLGEPVKGNTAFVPKTFKNFDGPVVQAPHVNLQGLERKVFFRNSMTYM